MKTTSTHNANSGNHESGFHTMRNRYALSLALLLSACAANTTLQSEDTAALQLEINKEAFALDSPASIKFFPTTFGQYKFKATSDDAEPMYGVMPLKFNADHFALDVLIFAPAMWRL